MPPGARTGREIASDDDSAPFIWRMRWLPSAVQTRRRGRGQPGNRSFFFFFDGRLHSSCSQSACRSSRHPVKAPALNVADLRAVGHYSEAELLLSAMPARICVMASSPE